MMTEIEREYFEYKLMMMYIITIMITFVLFTMMGGLMNHTAILRNDGKMPFLNEFGYEDNMYKATDNLSQVNYPALVDRFEILNCVWSLGDFMAIFGALGVLGCIIWSRITIYKYKKRLKTLEGGKE
jgi:hypothetical protein